MKQFDLYENTDKDTKEGYPYFVDVQTELLRELDSRVVIPLVPSKDAKTYPSNLCPRVTINNKTFSLLTHQITTVPASLLNIKEGSLLLNRDNIISGLDFLLTGI
jgi:toxin CcdB